MAKVTSCGSLVHKMQAKDSILCIHCGKSPIQWDETMQCHMSSEYKTPKKKKAVIPNDYSYDWNLYWKPVYSASNTSNDSFVQEYF